MLDIKQSVVTRFLLKNNFPPGIINLNKIQKNMTCEEYSRYVHALHSEQTSNFISYQFEVRRDFFISRLPNITRSSCGTQKLIERFLF